MACSDLDFNFTLTYSYRYRYDGLYVVEKAWIEPGNNPGGFKVVKFAFKVLNLSLSPRPHNHSTNCPCQRLPDQPPIPEQTDDEEAVVQNENEGANGDMADGRSEPETLPADENDNETDG